MKKLVMIILLTFIVVGCSSENPNEPFINDNLTTDAQYIKERYLDGFNVIKYHAIEKYQDEEKISDEINLQCGSFIDLVGRNCTNLYIINMMEFEENVVVFSYDGYYQETFEMWCNNTITCNLLITLHTDWNVILMDLKERRLI